eukprot:5007990-Amphidinium_carterae.1
MHCERGHARAVRAARCVLEEQNATVAPKSLGGARAAVKLLAEKSSRGDVEVIRSLLDVVHVDDIQME